MSLPCIIWGMKMRRRTAVLASTLNVWIFSSIQIIYRIFKFPSRCLVSEKHMLHNHWIVLQLFTLGRSSEGESSVTCNYSYDCWSMERSGALVFHVSVDAALHFGGTVLLNLITALSSLPSTVITSSLLLWCWQNIFEWFNCRIASSFFKVLRSSFVLKAIHLPW